MITDMTEGNPRKILFNFTLPMLISIFFQQLYNISDSIIVGKFRGDDALAAVGASYPVTMIFMAIAMGCNVGCSVIISQLFGNKDIKNMKLAINTSFISIFALSAILTLLGFVFSTPIMKLIGTPDNIFKDSALFLNVYIGGLVFLFLYNICTGIFTALGDSKTPLYFLIASSLGNIVLDLIFVGVMGMGVGGAAIATFIMQSLCSVLAFVCLLKRISKIRCEEKPKLFSGAMLGKISRIAIPSILQQSFVSVGNLFIQTEINAYGSAVIAGYSAAIKLNTFAITCFSALSNGLSNFTAQNIGAGKIDRVKKGYKSAIIMGLIAVIPFTLGYVFFGNQLIGLFMENKISSTQALETGIQFLTIVAPFYITVTIKLITDGVLRGAGSVWLFMISTFTDLIIRVVLAITLNHHIGITGIWLSWPIGWAIATIVCICFYISGKWKKSATI